MASTASSLSIHTPKICLTISKPSSKRASFRVNCQLSDEPKTLPLSLSLSIPKTLAVTGAIASTLAFSPLALAAKQIAESPQQDSRGLALLLPLVPAVGWVLFNILRPALNQFNKMRDDRAVIFGLGGLGLAAYSAFYVPVASAVSEFAESEGVADGVVAAVNEVAKSEGAAGADNSGLLPYIVAACVGLECVLFSVMQSKYEEVKH